MQTSQLTGLTNGTFSELFLQLPPGGNTYENVAVVLTTLTTDNEASGAVQEQLQDQIDGKQNLLTARFPIRLQNDVLSFWFSNKIGCYQCSSRANRPSNGDESKHR